MRHFLTIALAVIQLVAAAVLCYVAIAIPAHWMAVDRHVLKTAAQQSVSRSAVIKDLIDWGKPGAARLLISDTSKELRDARWAVEALESSNPQYRISGGADAYFNAFLEKLDHADISIEGRHTLMAQLAVRQAREELYSFLNASGKAAVHDVLASRDITGVTVFMPVNTAAGAPLDSAVLTSAMLVQGEFAHDELAQQLRFWSREAMRGDQVSTMRLERWYMTVLALGYRLNWVQLATLVDVTEKPSDLHTLAQLVKSEDEALTILYTSAIMMGDLGEVIQYVERFGSEHALPDLAWANAEGKGALESLLDRGLPIYKPRAWLEPFIVKPLLVDLVLEDSWKALLIRIVGLLAACYLMVTAFVGLTFWGRSGSVRGVDALPMLRNLLLASLLTTILLGLLESGHPIERSRADKPQQAGMHFVSFAQTSSPSSQNFMNDITTDTTTIVILLIFFVLQLIIYFIGLTRISQVRNTSGTATLRRMLLENEENFFDTGLYVGLGGTVASLILLAMNVVSASLIAAYASTLFGIVFVAILKIFHVRPYRRALIIEEANTTYYEG